MPCREFWRDPRNDVGSNRIDIQKRTRVGSVAKYAYGKRKATLDLINGSNLPVAQEVLHRIQETVGEVLTRGEGKSVNQAGGKAVANITTRSTPFIPEVEAVLRDFRFHGRRTKGRRVGHTLGIGITREKSQTL